MLTISTNNQITLNEIAKLIKKFRLVLKLFKDQDDSKLYNSPINKLDSLH